MFGSRESCYLRTTLRQHSGSLAPDMDYSCEFLIRMWAYSFIASADWTCAHCLWRFKQLCNSMWNMLTITLSIRELTSLCQERMVLLSLLFLYLSPFHRQPLRIPVINLC